jgi:hypothetical protein
MSRHGAALAPRLSPAAVARRGLQTLAYEYHRQSKFIKCALSRTLRLKCEKVRIPDRRRPRQAMGSATTPRSTPVAAHP